MNNIEHFYKHCSALGMIKDAQGWYLKNNGNVLRADCLPISSTHYKRASKGAETQERYLLIYIENSIGWIHKFSLELSNGDLILAQRALSAEIREFKEIKLL